MDPVKTGFFGKKHMVDKENVKKTKIYFMLGLKDKSAQIFDQAGAIVPVTLIKVKPCQITQVKTLKKDGYSAVQIGLVRNNKNDMWLKEKRLQNTDDIKVGQKINMADIFKPGDKIDITGISKAKGFQGTVKRYNFRGASATHGTRHAHRQPGSIGSTGPARVFKGTKMSGRMGGDTITVKNLTIAAIDPEKNILAVKGAVPGNRKDLLQINKA